MKDLVKKTEVLIEALPYIQQFHGAIAVIKFGGSAMEDPLLTHKTMREYVSNRLTKKRDVYGKRAYY